MKLLNTTPGNRFLCSLFFPMLIKPTYEKFYRIVYTRGKDQQTTEVVDTTIEQLTDLIGIVVKGRLSHPQAKTGKIPSTNVKVYTVDGASNKASLNKEYSHVYNQSPRNIRKSVESAILNL